MFRARLHEDAERAQDASKIQNQSGVVSTLKAFLSTSVRPAAPASPAPPARPTDDATPFPVPSVAESNGTGPSNSSPTGESPASQDGYRSEGATHKPTKKKSVIRMLLTESYCVPNVTIGNLSRLLAQSRLLESDRRAYLERVLPACRIEYLDISQAEPLLSHPKTLMFFLGSLDSKLVPSTLMIILQSLTLIVHVMVVQRDIVRFTKNEDGVFSFQFGPSRTGVPRQPKDSATSAAGASPECGAGEKEAALDLVKIPSPSVPPGLEDKGPAQQAASVDAGAPAVEQRQATRVPSSPPAEKRTPTKPPTTPSVSRIPRPVKSCSKDRPFSFPLPPPLPHALPSDAPRLLPSPYSLSLSLYPPPSLPLSSPTPALPPLVMLGASREKEPAAIPASKPAAGPADRPSLEGSSSLQSPPPRASASVGAISAAKKSSTASSAKTPGTASSSSLQNVKPAGSRALVSDILPQKRPVSNEEAQNKSAPREWENTASPLKKTAFLAPQHDEASQAEIKALKDQIQGLQIALAHSEKAIWQARDIDKSARESAYIGRIEELREETELLRKTVNMLLAQNRLLGRSKAQNYEHDRHHEEGQLPGRVEPRSTSCGPSPAGSARPPSLLEKGPEHVGNAGSAKGTDWACRWGRCFHRCGTKSDLWAHVLESHVRIQYREPP